jgi:S1-C subfamily serine protease
MTRTDAQRKNRYTITLLYREEVGGTAHVCIERKRGQAPMYDPNYDPNARDNNYNPYQESSYTTPYQRNQYYQQSRNTPPPPRRPKVPWSWSLLVLAIGLFLAGWAVGHVTATPALSATTLQSGTNVAVPALTGNNTSAVRVAVVAKVRPAVVLITVATAQGTALGSGVIIDKRGYIVTNNHVVNGAQSLQVTLFNGANVVGQVAGTDAADDLAIVKFTPPSANITAATLGDSSKLAVGEDVLAIGNPLGITQTVTNGIVSALGRSVSEGQGGATLPGAIQTDAPINPGNSGGALVDLQGEVIGIPTLTAIDPEFNAPANGVGFAIPSNRVRLIAPQIIATGTVAHTGRAALNIGVEPVDVNVAQMSNLAVNAGVLITSMQQGGAAAKAGLQAGDVIVQVDNTPVVDTSTLSDALLNKDPGSTVAVRIYRGNQQMTVNVTLGELQAG